MTSSIVLGSEAQPKLPGSRVSEASTGRAPTGNVLTRLTGTEAKYRNWSRAGGCVWTLRDSTAAAAGMRSHLPLGSVLRTDGTDGPCRGATQMRLGSAPLKRSRASLTPSTSG
jgi:hypothetical protein